MSKNLSSILEGWEHWLDPTKASEALALKRAPICATCPKLKKGILTAFINDELEEIQGKYCAICTCPISAKIRSTQEACPLNKW